MSRPIALLIVGAAAIYFLLPLFATAVFSLQAVAGHLSLRAYGEIAADPRFWATFRFSVGMALLTIVTGLAVTIPAAFAAHLKAPRIRPWLEFVSLLPFVVPAIVLVFGIVRLYGHAPLFLSSRAVMLVAAYAVLGLPYTLRAVDHGLRAIDVRVLTEAALSLGAGWFAVLTRVIIPNLRGAIMAAAFVVFALILGDLAVSSMLEFNTFGVYMEEVGTARAHGAAALAVISVVLVWAMIGLMRVLGGRGFSLGAGSR